MKTIISYEFDSEEEAKAFINGKHSPATQEAAAPAETKAPAAKGNTGGKGGKGKGSKKDVPKAAAGGEDQIPSEDDARAALSKLTAEKEIGVAREIFKKYGASNISSIPEDKRAAFIADCEAALAEE